MDNVLTATPQIDRAPRDFLESVGVIFRVFGPETQDSGNVSYGVEVAGICYFVKTTDPDAAVLLDYDERVELLRNAVRVAHSCENIALPKFLNLIESPQGPMLIYDWADGSPLPDESARQRFRQLPNHEIEDCLSQIFELHVDLADAGWVSVAFYDGCLIYDFSRRKLHIVDLDGYHQGSFLNSIGRMFGSSRFMAPEKLTCVQLIDERTTVFTMGRTASVLLADGTLDRDAFRGGEGLYKVMVQACQPLPHDRFESVRQFYEAWQGARQGEQ